MSNHTYTRNLVGDHYDLLFEEVQSGEEPSLKDKIMAQFPTLTSIKIEAFGPALTIKISPSLDAGESLILDQIVDNSRLDILPLTPESSGPIEGLDLNSVQARRTSTYYLGDNFADLSFQSTDLENEPDTVEHNNLNQDRIDIKSNGVYLINYDILGKNAQSANFRIEAQVRKNDTSVLPGSSKYFQVMDTDDNGGVYPLTNSFLAYLQNGEFITLQVREANGEGEVLPESTLMIVKLEGLEGPQGDPGSIGPDEFEFGQETDIETTTLSLWQNKTSISTANLSGGTYKVSWSYFWNHDSTSSDFQARITYDGYVKMLHRQEPKDSNGSLGATGTNQRIPASGFFLVNDPGGASRTINLEYSTSSAGKSSSVWEAYITIEKVDDFNAGANGVAWETTD